MEKEIKVKEISPDTTQDWLKEGALLVDVREKDEVAQLAYDVDHIVNIPLSEFENRWQEIDKNQKVVVACRSGARSLRATAYLIHQGYDPASVVNMQNGIIGWQQKGYPTQGN